MSISKNQGPLRLGASVTSCTSRLPVTVERHLGGGTQGIVYAASMGATRLALKWYWPSYLRIDPGLRQRLTALMAMGPPSDRFVWPIDLVEQAGTPGFGYVMPLMEAPFVSMNAVVTGKADPSFRTLATIGLGLAQGFLDLHARGLSYCDISFGNIWIDPERGDVRICDNDNVTGDGKLGALSGSPRFMAPEIVRGESGPSIATDLHSLAVTLFWMLMMHHPMIGRREAEVRFPTQEDELRIFGTEALFIFDPLDNSNAPVPGEQDMPLVYWPLYPRFLRALFVQAFTHGLKDPQGGRVMESAWRRAMGRLRDLVVECTECGVENFHDPQADAGSSAPCWQCAMPRATFLLLQLKRSEIVVAPHTILYPHHLLPGREFDFSVPLARIESHPTQPSLLGLYNGMGESWTVTLANGRSASVPDGKRVQLEPGMTIDFGPTQGSLVLQS